MRRNAGRWRESPPDTARRMPDDQHGILLSAESTHSAESRADRAGLSGLEAKRLVGIRASKIPLPVICQLFSFC